MFRVRVQCAEFRVDSVGLLSLGRFQDFAFRISGAVSQAQISSGFRVHSVGFWV